MTELNIILDESIVKKVKELATGGDMRKVYGDYDSAKAAFNKAAKEAKKHDVAVFEHSAESFEGMRPVVGVVGTRTKQDGEIVHGIRGLVMFPIPSIDSILAAGETARTWLDSVAEKESSHVAYRQLRNAESIEEFLQEAERMPTTVDAFVTATPSGIDTSAVDSIWLSFRERLKELAPALAKKLPQKAEVIKSIRSKPYADEEHGELESIGIFVQVGEALINACAKRTDPETGDPAPLDSSAIRGWLDNRETTTIPRGPRKDVSVEQLGDVGAQLAQI